MPVCSQGGTSEDFETTYFEYLPESGEIIDPARDPNEDMPDVTLPESSSPYGTLSGSEQSYETSQNSHGSIYNIPSGGSNPLDDHVFTFESKTGYTVDQSSPFAPGDSLTDIGTEQYSVSETKDSKNESAQSEYARYSKNITAQIWAEELNDQIKDPKKADYNKNNMPRFYSVQEQLENNEFSRKFPPREKRELISLDGLPDQAKPAPKVLKARALKKNTLANKKPFTKIRKAVDFDLIKDTKKWDPETIDAFYQLYKQKQSKSSHSETSLIMKAIKQVMPSAWGRSGTIIKWTKAETEYFEARISQEKKDEEFMKRKKTPEEILPISTDTDRLDDPETIQVQYERRGYKPVPNSKTFYEAKFPFKKVDLDKADLKKLYRLNDVVFPDPIYKNFDGTFDVTVDTNCLRSMLIANYTNATKSSISKNTIVKWFESDTSIDNLEKFLLKYNISYKIYNLVGCLVSKFKALTRSGRAAFNIICYAGHIYKWTGSSQKITFESLPKTNEPERIKIPKILEQAFNFNPNFIYKAEENVLIKAMLYETQNLDAIYNNHDETIYKIDAKRCYYQMMFHLCTEDTIGVFSCDDQIELYTQGDDIVDWYEYYLTDNGFAKLPFMNTNKMLGRTLNYLITERQIIPDDILMVKKATYKIKVKDIIDVYTAHGVNDTNFKCFSILYGKLGTVNRDNRHLAADIIAEYDEDLIKLFSPETSTLDIRMRSDTVGYMNYCTMSKFMHVNNRNVYEFIIDSANRFVLAQIFNLQARGAKIHAIKTDSIQFSIYGENPITTTPKGTYDNITLWSPEEPTQIAGAKYERVAYNQCIMFDIKNEQKTMGESVKFINLKPGMGKTHFVSRNLKYDMVFVMSNIMANKLTFDITDAIKEKANEAPTKETIKAQTLYKGLKLGDKSKSNSAHGKTIWVDEMSQINRFIWNVIFNLIGNGAKFIISGDINQTPPIGEKSIEDSNIYRVLNYGNIIIPPNPNPRNDQRTTDLADQCLTKPLEEIPQILDILLDQNETLDKVFHMCFTLKYKDQLNAKIMKHRNLSIDFEKKTMSSGIILQCMHENKALELNNGSRFITTAGEKDIKLIEILDPNSLSNLGRIIEIPFADLCKVFRLGFCTTVSSCQGLTISESLVIHEIDKLSRFDKKLLYTGITRIKGYDKLSLCDESYDKDDVNDPFATFNAHSAFKNTISSKIGCKTSSKTPVKKIVEVEQPIENGVFSPVKRTRKAPVKKVKEIAK